MEYKEQSIKDITFQKIDSTYIYARNEALKLLSQAKQWYAIRAEEQTGGIGQSNRLWKSPPDVNLYVTFIVPWDEKHINTVPYLTQVSSVSIAEVLEELGFEPKIKWVNDILLNNKKVSGIIAEASIQGEDSYALVGIGININMDAKDCASIDQPVTSLNFENNGEKIDKLIVYEKLKAKLFDNVQTLMTKGFGDFLNYIKNHIAYLGKKVRILDKADNLKYQTGVFKGLDENGFIILELGNGNEVILNNGRMFLEKDQFYTII